MLVLCLGAALFVTTGCRDRGETARRELKEKGYEVTPEAFFRAAESDDVVALKELLAHGIAADVRNPAGDTALHAAAVAGMKKSVEFLLDKGVPVDIAGAEGRTPLMATVLKGSPAMARYLLTRRADPNKKDAKGYKALTLAVTEGPPGMVSVLAPYDRENLDASLLVAALEGRAPAIDELTKYGASVYARMDDGRTALMVAAEHGNIEAVEMLLDLGANRFSMDEQGKIAADSAREAGHEELAKLLAEEPKQSEYGLEEPSDLGKEMMALMAAADKAAGMTGDAPDAPPVLEAAVLKPLPAVTNDGAPAGPSGSGAAPFVMRAYRQRELPLRVESSGGEGAKLRLAGVIFMEGGQVTQARVPATVGQGIPNSRLKVVRVGSRMQVIKDSSKPAERVTVVELEDVKTGLRREIISGLESTAEEPVALVEDGAGKRYVARTGQKFRSATGEDFTVIDVRPNQMVIENRSKGEVITVPLRGPRG